jgi:hypothetical protein
MTPPPPRDPSPTSKPSLSDRWYRLPWAARIGLVVVTGLAAVAVVGNLRQAGPSTQPRASTPPPAATSAVPDGQIGPGVYLVGTDVTPGTYRTTGAYPGESTAGYCMWSRHSTADGGPMDNIIASDGSRPGAPLIVTIDAADVLFRTDGCEPWAPVG